MDLIETILSSLGIESGDTGVGGVGGKGPHPK